MSIIKRILGVLGPACPLCLLGVVVAFALGCVAFGAILLDRVRSVQQAEFAAGHIADLAANRSADLLRRVAADLDAMAESVRAADASRPGGLAQISTLINQRRNLSSDGLGLYLVGMGGHLLADGDSSTVTRNLPPSICLQDSNLDPGAMTLRPATVVHPSGEVQNVICAIRAVATPSFIGTALAVVSEAAVQAEYSDLSPGPHSLIVLLDANGRRLAASGALSGEAPERVESAAWLALLRGSTPSLGPDISEARRVDGPIHAVVIVAFADADALAAWWARAGLLASSALIVVAFVALAVLAVRRTDLREVARLDRLSVLASELQGVSHPALLARRVVEAAMRLVACEQVPETVPTIESDLSKARPLSVVVIESDLVQIGGILLRRCGGRYYAPADLAALRAVVAVAQGGVGVAQSLHASEHALSQARAEAELLRHSGETVLNEMSDVVIILDTRWRFVGANRNADRLFGEHADDLLNRPIWEVFPELVGTSFEIECRRSMAHGHPATFDLRWLRGDVWLAVQIYPRMPGLAIYMHDISRHVGVDDRLRQNAKMEAIGRLTGAIAHDFNNLLTVILGNIETLDLELPQSGEVREMHQQIGRAASEAAALTRQLLAFARRQSLAPVDLDVGQLVRGLNGLLRHMLGAGYAVETHCPASLWPARIDPVQLEATITNLAQNAREAMPQGGRLTIEAANLTLRRPDGDAFGEIRPGNYVVLSVGDSGTGIAPELLDRVFDPFFSTKPLARGAGLGLSMVYGFITQSGGHVRISSEPRNGTTVRLYLPSPGAPGGAPKTLLDATSDSRTGQADPRKQILLVEDAGMVRDYAAGVLTGLGYDVAATSDGRAALALLDSGFEPDLLLTDILLANDLDGLALARRVRTLRPDIAVLFMSGYVESGDAAQDELDPNENLLLKPFARANLAAMVRRQLDQPTSNRHRNVNQIVTKC